MLEKSAQVGQHSYEERGADSYATPVVAVHALLKAEKIPQVARVWEPACGSGNIAGTLVQAGYRVYGSDLHDRGWGTPGVDFLSCSPALYQNHFEAIITNPPYQLAAPFVMQALECAPLVIMLLRLAFYEGVNRTYLLEEAGLARVHVFRNRLPMMHREGWAGPKASSAIPFAWFVWERGHKGPTIFDRISWEA